MTSASLNSNGTPDRYIDGPGGDLWVEFKYLKRIPKYLDPDQLLSSLQLKWLTRRGAFGNAVVVIGIETGARSASAVVLDQVSEWTTTFDKASVELRLQSINDVSNYLTRRVTCTHSS